MASPTEARAALRPPAATEYPHGKSEAEWRQALSASEFKMLRQRGTEAPGRGEYHQFFPTDGYFGCRACEMPLYSATSKFKDCGWDAFDRCFFTGENCHVGVRPDAGSVEIVCNGCGSHLGHVFYGEKQTPTDERH